MAVVNKWGMTRPDNGGVVLTNVGGVGFANGDQSQPIALADRNRHGSVQVTGTFGAGGSVQVEKSNDGTNFVVLAAGDVVSGTHPTTAAGVVEFQTSARFLRLNVTAGDGTTSLFATMVLNEDIG